MGVHLCDFKYLRKGSRWTRRRSQGDFFALCTQHIIVAYTRRILQYVVYTRGRDNELVNDDIDDDDDIE